MTLSRRLYWSLAQPLRYRLRGRWRLPRTDEPRPARAGLRAAYRGAGPSVWVLSSQTWYSSIFQRPQQLARALAEVGCAVIYTEPWSSQAIITAAGQQLRRFTGLRRIAPRLHLLRCPVAQIPWFLATCPPDALLMSWPDQARWLPDELPSRVIYEMIDDHELFAESVEPAWQQAHRHWLHAADLMVASADNLLQICRAERPDTLLLPNAVRLEDWRRPGPRPVPADLAAARAARGVVGYYGSVASWFDWETWAGAARRRPDLAFVVLGIAYDSCGREYIERMKAIPNMHYLGPKPYDALPDYLAHCDVAAIPFVLNPITHACSPLKLFEYMAGGKPIVASPMQEILKYQSVLFAEGPETFARQIDEALRRRDDPAYRALLEREAQANTWRARAAVLRREIETARPRRPAPPPAGVAVPAVAVRAGAAGRGERSC